MNVLVKRLNMYIVVTIVYRAILIFKVNKTSNK